MVVVVAVVVAAVMAAASAADRTPSRSLEGPPFVGTSGPACNVARLDGQRCTVSASTSLPHGRPSTAQTRPRLLLVPTDSGQELTDAQRSQHHPGAKTTYPSTHLRVGSRLGVCAAPA